MKVTLHIPVEQYGFAEVEMEAISADAIAEAYQEVRKAFAPKPINVLPTKDFNAFLDQYLKDCTGNLEVYNSMSPAQQQVIQEIKKSLKRINK